MILCSSGALFEPNAFDAETILTYGPQLPVDGLEILVTDRMVGRLDETTHRLRGCGLTFPVVHAPKRLGAALPDLDAVDQLDVAARFADAVGAQTLVLHLWDLPDSDTDFEGRLDAAVLAADVVTDRRCRLSIETIPCDRGTPLANVERVLDREPRVSVTLDTEFLALHGQLEATLDADWLWAEGIVANIHVKDFDGGLFRSDGRRRYLQPGDGTIDFPRLFETLADRGYSGSVSLEAPARGADGRPNLATLSSSLARMGDRPWSFR